MAGQILVNPGDLMNKSSQIRSYKENHHDVMTKMTNLVIHMCEVWKGEAQDAFVSKYLSMQQIFDNFENNLEDFADLMEKIAKEMEKADQDGRNTINSIH